MILSFFTRACWLFIHLLCRASVLSSIGVDVFGHNAGQDADVSIELVAQSHRHKYSQNGYRAGVAAWVQAE